MSMSDLDIQSARLADSDHEHQYHRDRDDGQMRCRHCGRLCVHDSAKEVNRKYDDGFLVAVVFQCPDCEASEERDP